MGSSFVSLEEAVPADKQNIWLGDTYGFWAADGPLIDWYVALAETIAADETALAWLRELGEYWFQLDGNSGAGYVPDRLKDFATDSARKAVLIEISTRTMQRALITQATTIAPSAQHVQSVLAASVQSPF